MTVRLRTTSMSLQVSGRRDATLLAPVAVTGLTLATTSAEIGEIGRPHVSGVLLV